VPKSAWGKHSLFFHFEPQPAKKNFDGHLAGLYDFRQLVAAVFFEKHGFRPWISPQLVVDS